LDSVSSTVQNIGHAGEDIGRGVSRVDSTLSNNCLIACCMEWHEDARCITVMARIFSWVGCICYHST